MEKRYCECGCGSELPSSSNSRFKRGHHSRVPERGNRLPDKPPICACGCGEEIAILPHHAWVGAPQYRVGHAVRGRPNSQRKTPPDDWIPPTGICGCGCGQKTRISERSYPDRGIYAGYPLRYINGHLCMDVRTKKRETKSLAVATIPADVETGFACRDREGYVVQYVLNHPRYPRKRILQHRFVMELKLGRWLEKHERVHHINGDRADNRPENLELWKIKTKSHPPGVRAADYHCPGCRCGEDAEAA